MLFIALVMLFPLNSLSILYMSVCRYARLKMMNWNMKGSQNHQYGGMWQHSTHSYISATITIQTHEHTLRGTHTYYPQTQICIYIYISAKSHTYTWWKKVKIS